MARHVKWRKLGKGTGWWRLQNATSKYPVLKGWEWLLVPLSSTLWDLGPAVSWAILPAGSVHRVRMHISPHKFCFRCWDWWHHTLRRNERVLLSGESRVTPKETHKWLVQAGRWDELSVFLEARAVIDILMYTSFPWLLKRITINIKAYDTHIYYYGSGGWMWGISFTGLSVSRAVLPLREDVFIASSSSWWVLAFFGLRLHFHLCL